MVFHWSKVTLIWQINDKFGTQKFGKNHVISVAGHRKKPHGNSVQQLMKHTRALKIFWHLPKDFFLS